jgi:two-component system sensor histidine kinase TctE
MREVSSFFSLILATEVVLVTAAGLLVWWGVNKALRALRALEREVSLRSADDLSTIDLVRVPVETRSLIDALNALLGRLVKSHAEQKRFIADAAHQLRTPLARIQAQAEVLKKSSAVDLPEHCNRLEQSIAKSIRQTNQLLALARAESHTERPFTKQPVDLAGLVREMMGDWVLSAGERNIDLGFKLNSAVTECDAFLVRQAIGNLVDNALCYAPSGGVVNISTGRTDNAVWIAVDDNGPGVPERHREHIFQRFYRLPDSPGAGSGLGLAIVKAIADAHQAEACVETSTLGGARFSLRFAALAPEASQGRSKD